MRKSPERFARIEATLRKLSERDLYRQLQRRTGRDFSSNDYLGLADSEALRKALSEGLERGVPVGAGGSRLLRGHHEEHEALEAEAARFFGAEACLAFGSGYAANLALMALPRRGDLLIYDQLAHASMHHGMQGSQADVQAAPHNDADAFQDAAKRWRQAGGKGSIWIAVESLYSMDGDCAPLRDLMAIAEAEDGFLIVDEAHATGVFGRSGRGLAEEFEGREALIALHTGGKALGSTGALVTADRRIIDLLINRARSFIYATALPPILAATLRASLILLADEPWRREQLQTLTTLATQMLRDIPGVVISGTQIIPMICGESRVAIRLAAGLQKAGFDCRAIRPPTVPAGTSRLRFSVTLNTDEYAIRELGSTLSELLAIP